MRTLVRSMSLAVAMMGGAAFAQAPMPTTTTTTTHSAVVTQKASSSKGSTPASAPKTAVSKDCSNQSNAKNLHGKERKKFRSACKREAARGLGARLVAAPL